ncbi:DUF7024 domain-containing protein [Pseudoduganella danionis]|uniref:DUF7024 domain-containing protein n=1 Tax=Pseudoduganella danionis TaxID=1890295 RepID=A0ABW9SJ55_9BURK|nr:hypothetical protein [Pseudoduganella danionis]MTW31670.1 hypothetical protein [Pseudoduganella danionis]
MNRTNSRSYMSILRPASAANTPIAPVLAALSLLVLFVLIWRNQAAYPLIFMDEWSYSSFARLQPLAQASVPSYLYLALFGLSSACGDAFLQCTRIGNALLVVAAVPFLYLTGRRYCSAPLAATLALLAVLAPFNSYTVYFMPEATYFFGFSVLSWAVLARHGQWPDLAVAALGGALLGALSLVKVHALFLTPALLAFIWYCGWRRTGWRALPLLLPASTVITVACLLAVKLTLGYLLAGPAGLSLLGSFYGGHANNSSGLAHLLPVLAAAWQSLQGHVLGLILMYAVPVAALLTLACSRQQRQAVPGAAKLSLYTVLMLGAALAMTVAYTGSIASAAPGEGERMHLRYYDFVFPLILLSSAGLLAVPDTRRAVRLAWAVPLALGLLLAQLWLPAHFHPSFIDGPELSLPMRWLGWLQLPLLAMWVWRPRQALLGFLLVLTPLTCVVGELQTRNILSRAEQPSPYDLAGRYAHQTLSPQQRASLSIAGAEVPGIYRAMFHVDQADVGMVRLQPGAPLELTQAPGDSDWLLVVGEHAIPPQLSVFGQGPGYTLLRLPARSKLLRSLNFNQPDRAILASASGLCDAEHWGSWTQGKQLDLQFTEALPQRLTIQLRGHAYGPNIGAPVVARVGNQERTFRFNAGDSEQDVTLQFDTDGQQRSLHLTIPHPTTPASVSQGNDSRALGLGLINLRIAERPASP